MYRYALRETSGYANDTSEVEGNDSSTRPSLRPHSIEPSPPREAVTVVHSHRRCDDPLILIEDSSADDIAA